MLLRRPLPALLLALALFAALLASCGDEDVPTDPPDVASAGSSGAGGAAATASSTVATSGTGGEAPSGVPGVVGRTCKEDADCTPGRCIQAALYDSTFGGGPAGGYCTFACVEDADCPDPDSRCLVNDAGVGECLLGCTFGDPPLLAPPDYIGQPLDPSKCHGREDVGCFRLTIGESVCWPMCGSDTDCEDGLLCDPYFGSCVEKKTEGGAFGTECDKGELPPECEGYCVGVGGVTTLCSEPCAIGGPVDATTTKCGGIDRAACVVRSNGIGLGDHGFCGPTCKQQDDCRAPDFFCYEFGLPEGYGVCRVREPCTGDAGCPWPGSSCVETSFGKYCMSAVFPLGSIAPM